MAGSVSGWQLDTCEVVELLSIMDNSVNMLHKVPTATIQSSSETPVSRLAEAKLSSEQVQWPVFSLQTD